MPKKQHDVDDDPMFDTSKDAINRATNRRLVLLFEQIERLEEEKKGIADDIKDVFAEAKAVGYDTKIMRFVLKLRKMKPEDRAEWDALIDTYRAEADV